MKEYLAYIHHVGPRYNDLHHYQFLFTTEEEEIEGENWDSYPANGNPSPPPSEFISSVGDLISNVSLELAQNSELFSMWDSIDGVIPLGWEDISGLEEYPQKRLIFPYRMSMKDVTSLLYERDIVLDYSKKLENEKRN